MTTIILLQFGALFLLLALSAFFSSSEVALFSLNPIHVRRIAQRNTRAAQRIQHILNPPTRFLSTILIANTLINVLIAIVGYALAEDLTGGRGEGVAIIAVTLLLLIFGEIGPKRIAMLWPEKLSVLYAAPLTGIMHALTPFRAALESITTAFEPVFRPRGKTLSEEEFETVVEMSGEHGVLLDNEREMVQAIMRLEELHASDVMTPRVDLIGCNLNDPGLDLIAIARRAKVRQLVLFRDSIDQVEGFLDTRRFLLDTGHRVQAAQMPAIYVPEAAPLDRVLSHFLRECRRAAVVVDEYGGTAGIITRGDILEEITGEIDDEHAAYTRLFDPTGPDRWMIDGQVSLEDINQKLDLQLEAEGVDRLAGWIAHQLERLPRPGDTVQAQGCRAVVQQMRKHRVTMVQLERLPHTDHEEKEKP